MWPFSSTRKPKVLPETIAIIGNHGKQFEFPVIDQVENPHIIDGWIEMEGEVISFTIRLINVKGENLGTQTYSPIRLANNRTEVNLPGPKTEFRRYIYQLENMDFILPPDTRIMVEGYTKHDGQSNPDYKLIIKYQ